MAELSEIERDMLDFERQWFKFRGSYDQAIRDRFDITAIRYHQQLNALIEQPEALAYAPTVVKRLLRQREARGRSRASRAPA
jgi:hypothetical protein